MSLQCWVDTFSRYNNVIISHENSVPWDDSDKLKIKDCSYELNGKGKFKFIPSTYTIFFLLKFAWLIEIASDD